MPLIQDPNANPDLGQMQIYALTSETEDGTLSVTGSTLAGETLEFMVNEFHPGATPFIVDYNGSYSDNSAMLAALKNAFSPALS